MSSMEQQRSVLLTSSDFTRELKEYIVKGFGTASRPLLLNGPTKANKIEAVTKLSKDLKKDPVVISSLAEWINRALPEVSFFGPIVYIIDLDSLDRFHLFKSFVRNSKLPVIYTCHDIYDRFRSHASKFQIIHIEKYISKNSDNISYIDTNWVCDKQDSVSLKPWEVVNIILDKNGKKNTLEEKLAAIRTQEKSSAVFNPMIATVQSNVKNTGNIDLYAKTTNWLSEMDSKAFELNSDVIRILGVLKPLVELGNTSNNHRFDYTYRWDKTTPVADLPKDIYQQSSEEWSTTNAKSSSQKRKNTSTDTNTSEPKKRSPPKCRRCQVPLKGHKCPHRKTK